MSLSCEYDMKGFPYSAAYKREELASIIDDCLGKLVDMKLIEPGSYDWDIDTLNKNLQEENQKTPFKWELKARLERGVQPEKIVEMLKIYIQSEMKQRHSYGLDADKCVINCEYKPFIEAAQQVPMRMAS